LGPEAGVKGQGVQSALGPEAVGEVYLVDHSGPDPLLDLPHPLQEAGLGVVAMEAKGRQGRGEVGGRPDGEGGPFHKPPLQEGEALGVVEEGGLGKAGHGRVGGKPQVAGELVGEKAHPGGEEAPPQAPFQVAEEVQSLPHPAPVQVEPPFQDLEAVPGL
jgi:hypothetical protein